MNQQSEISDYISELISIGYSSLNRDKGIKILEAFQTINKGLRYLENKVSIFPEDFSKCVILLKLLVELRENLISSEDVRDSQIPNIYKSVDLINNFLIKSANQTIKNEDTKSITRQCEIFLTAADEIRTEKKLKGLGILDGKLKNVIGVLRKEANIESVFIDEHYKTYTLITVEADEILNDGDLPSIGEKFLDLEKKNGLLEKEYETLYLKEYHENEIVLDGFYEYPLKGLAPEDIIRILREKIGRLKKLDLSEVKYIPLSKG